MTRRNKIVVFTLTAIFIFLTLIYIALRAAFSWEFKTGTDISTMLDTLIDPGVEAKLTNIQGGGVTWQGHNIYLRFYAEPDFVTYLENIGFKTSACEDLTFRTPDVDSLSEYSTTFIPFNPEWNLVFSEKTVCLYLPAGVFENHRSAETAIAVDLETNEVYLSSISA